MLVVAVTALSLAGLAGPAVASAAPQPVSTVFAWIDRNQLPVDATPPPVPVDLPGGTSVTALAVGARHNLAVTSDGRLLAWGYNAWGQLGGRQHRGQLRAGAG